MLKQLFRNFTNKNEILNTKLMEPFYPMLLQSLNKKV